MFKIVNHILYFTMFCMVCFFGNYGEVDIIVVALCMVVSWGVSHIGLSFAKSRRSTELSVLSIGLVMFYWVTYVTKFGLGMFLSGQYWVVDLIISDETLIREMPIAFALATLGYLSLMAGLLSYPLGGRLRWVVPDFRPRIRLLAVLLPLVLVSKYALKDQFSLGMPGVDPQYLGLPYLAGLLTLMISTGFLFVSNILLFFGLVLGRPKLMLYGLLLGFANAGIDLRFGSKDTVMYELAITAAYLAIARFSLVTSAADFRKTARIALSALVVIGITVISAYKFMNYFRFALLMGGDVDLSAAINTALSNEGAISHNSFMEIYNRITGLETLAALVSLHDIIETQGSLLSIFDGSVVQTFTRHIMGTDDAKTMFSVTQFGYYYLSGGLAGLVFGCFFLGFCFRLIQFFVLRMKINHAMKLAFLPVLYIIFIKSLLGGGDMFLWLKNVIVLLATFYIAARLACPNSPNTYTAYFPRAKMDLANTPITPTGVAK